MNAKYYEKNFKDCSLPQGPFGTHRQRPALLPTNHFQCPHPIQKIQVRTYQKREIAEFLKLPMEDLEHWNLD